MLVTRVGLPGRHPADGRRASGRGSAARRDRVGPLAAAVLAVVLLVAGLAGGLATALAESPSPSPPVVLRVGWAEEPDALNPFVSAARSSREVWSLVYDTLIDYDAAPLADRKSVG